MDLPKTCFICRNPSSSANACCQIDEGSAFEFLCELFNFHFLLKPESKLGRINNSQFCDKCSQKIRETMLCRTQLKFLEEQVRDLKSQLQEEIICAYRWTPATTVTGKETSNGIQTPEEIIGRLMSQCWSKCRVAIPRLLTNTVGANGKEDRFEQLEDARDRTQGEVLEDNYYRLSFTDLENSEVHDPASDGMSISSDKSYQKSDDFDIDGLLSDAEWTETASKSITIRKRGRPRKHPIVKHEGSVKLKRGRPRKHPLVKGEETVKLKRGRPKKNPVVPEVAGTVDKAEDDEGPINESVVIASESEATTRSAENVEQECVSEGPTSIRSNKSIREKKRRKRGPNLSKPLKIPIVCKTCGQNFKKRPELKTHLQNEHRLDILNLCKFCGHNFEQNRTSEDSENPFKCGYQGCERKYPSIALLRVHHHVKCPDNPRVQERADKRFKCEKCDKAYYISTHLRDHIASVHDKTYRCCCEICGQGFQHESLLKKHLKYVHSTEKRHQCEDCGRRFKRPEQLMYHRRHHTGYLPFVCDDCGKAFAKLHDLDKHKNNMHSNTTFPCPLCSKMFPSTHYVRNHVEGFHKRNPKYMNKKPQDRNKSLSHDGHQDNSIGEGSSEMTSRLVGDSYPRTIEQNDELRPEAVVRTHFDVPIFPDPNPISYHFLTRPPQF